MTRTAQVRHCGAGARKAPKGRYKGTRGRHHASSAKARKLDNAGDKLGMITMAKTPPHKRRLKTAASMLKGGFIQSNPTLDHSWSKAGSSMD